MSYALLVFTGEQVCHGQGRGIMTVGLVNEVL